jgi:hypothetical protein
MKVKIIPSLVLALVLVCVPIIALAQGNPDLPTRRIGGEGQQIIPPLRIDSVAQVLNAFFGILIQVGAVIVTLAIVYAGFLFVVARGNPEELNKAKETLKWTIVGALVLLGAQVISKVIENTIKSIGA